MFANQLPSLDSLLCEASSHCLVKSRISAVITFSNAVRESIEARLGVNSIAVRAVATVEQHVSPFLFERDSPIIKLVSPLVDTIDDGIGNVFDTISFNDEIEVSSNSIDDMLLISMIRYAEDFLTRARQNFQVTKSRLHNEFVAAIDMASTRLHSLKTKLGGLYQSLPATSLDGRLQALFDNVVEALAKSKNITKSTLTYLDKNSLLVIPNDMLDFFSKLLGWRERDAQFNDVVQQFNELFDALGSVFILSQKASPCTFENTANVLSNSPPQKSPAAA